MKLPKRKFLKYTLYFVVFGIIFTAMIVASEFVFMNKNGSEYLYPHYLYLTKIFVQKEDIGMSLFFLGKSAEIKLGDVVSEYPERKLSTKIDIPDLPNDTVLKQHYIRLLQNVKYEELSGGYASMFSKTFYLLGLTAYRDNEPGLIVPFWQISVRLAPEWSYFHLELANYYLISGQIDNARAQLEYCLLFKYPKDECLRYLDSNFQTKLPEKVGAWQKQIEAIR